MKSLNDRGAAAFEFAIVGGTFIMLMFAIFDLGLYAITMQSLHALADAEARWIMIDCYTPTVTRTPKESPSACTVDTMPLDKKQDAAPFLYSGSLTPTVNIASSGSALKITVAQPGFTATMPIWGDALNSPTTSTEIPY